MKMVLALQLQVPRVGSELIEAAESLTIVPPSSSPQPLPHTYVAC